MTQRPEQDEQGKEERPMIQRGDEGLEWARIRKSRNENTGPPQVERPRQRTKRSLQLATQKGVVAQTCKNRGEIRRK